MVQGGPDLTLIFPPHFYENAASCTLFFAIPTPVFQSFNTYKHFKYFYFLTLNGLAPQSRVVIFLVASFYRSRDMLRLVGHLALMQRDSLEAEWTSGLERWN